MSLINTPLRALFDALLYPFRELSPLISLVPISIVIAIAMLLIFKKTSNQDALEAVKRKIHAGLFEIRLFNDDLGFIFRSQTQILRATLTYMRLSIVPMLWTLPPLILIIAQLQFHYGYEGFAPGQTTQLHVVLNEDQVGDGKPDISVQSPPGINVIEPAVWVASLREMAWRVDVQALGDFDLEISLGGEAVVKTVHAGGSIVRRSPFRVAGFLDELIYPAEPALPSDSPFELITIDYVDTNVDVFGFGIHWMIVFFILSMAFAFALRKPFGVTL